jgi:hypothetical protein
VHTVRIASSDFAESADVPVLLPRIPEVVFSRVSATPGEWEMQSVGALLHLRGVSVRRRREAGAVLLAPRRPHPAALSLALARLVRVLQLYI